MLIIGFGNRARHGKDTACNAVIAAMPHFKIQTLKFADCLYQEVNQFLETAEGAKFLMDEEVRVGEITIPAWVQANPDRTPQPMAPYGKHAKLLQWWGTEYRRAQDNNYWVKKAMASIPRDLDIALFSDVRFPNEADAIKQAKGYTVQVTRFNEDGSAFRDPSRDENHPSETALDYYNWDYYIRTRNEVDYTKFQAVNLVHWLRQKVTYEEYVNGR